MPSLAPGPSSLSSTWPSCSRVEEHCGYQPHGQRPSTAADRKSTRLNSSHMSISYAVVCLKKKRSSLPPHLTRPPHPPPERSHYIQHHFCATATRRAYSPRAGNTRGSRSRLRLAAHRLASA